MKTTLLFAVLAASFSLTAQTAPVPVQLVPCNPCTLSDTSIPQAQSNAYFAVYQLVDQMDASLVSGFLNQFSVWKTNYLGAHATLSTMPVPPASYVVAYFNDPTTGPGSHGPYGDTVIQWPYPSQTGAPVIAAPAIPVLPTTQPVAWFQANGGNTVNCAIGDTMPDGYIATDTTGVKWIKHYSPTPFGVACRYDKQ